MKTLGYRGKGPEVVLVGFEETCCLGYARDKYAWYRDGSQNEIELGLRMGILEFQDTGQGVRKLFEVKAPPADSSASSKGVATPLEKGTQRVLNETNADEVEEFKKRWSAYIRAHTGIRQLTLENCSFDPNNFQTLSVQRIRKENLTKADLELLRSLQIQIEDVQQSGETFSATIVSVIDKPFPFPLDFGGPLPTGWRLDNLGLPTKEVRKMNPALLMMYDTAYRILLQGTLHPSQTKITDFYDTRRLSLHCPSGMGPMIEIEAIGLSTFHGDDAKPKQLSHSLANTILGYLAPSLSIKGKISTHVGACESVMGGIGDVFRDIKSGAYDGSLVIGYDWAMTAVAYNGFCGNGAMITNEQLVKVAKKLAEDGLLTDPTLIAEIDRRLQNEESLSRRVLETERRAKQGHMTKEAMREERARIQDERVRNWQSLPKGIYEIASMPFHKYRSGFVMSIGAGGGFFTTLEHAVREGLPIRALVSGVGEKIPDGPGDGYGSIAVLGDGVGDAFEKSFLESRANYVVPDGKNGTREFTMNDIGAWWAHGTSTPTNGFGERREIQRIAEKYGRSAERPIPMSGDKEIGHRIGGNFPSQACFILEDQTIYPLRNYSLADEELDRSFPLTRVVGKAGLGAGQAIPLEGEFIAINGAGFGKINSNIMLKRFRVEDLDIPAEAQAQYIAKCAKRIEESKKLAERIRRGETPLVVDTAETAKSRGEESNLSKQIRAPRSVAQ